MSGIKKLKISPKLFTFGKTIDLPVGRQSSPSPFTFVAKVPSLSIEDDYEKLLIKQHEELERRQKMMSAKLIIIAKQKQSIQAHLEVLRQKKRGASSTTSRAI